MPFLQSHMSGAHRARSRGALPSGKPCSIHGAEQKQNCMNRARCSCGVGAVQGADLLWRCAVLCVSNRNLSQLLLFSRPPRFDMRQATDTHLLGFRAVLTAPTSGFVCLSVCLSVCMYVHVYVYCMYGWMYG